MKGRLTICSALPSGASAAARDGPGRHAVSPGPARPRTSGTRSACEPWRSFGWNYGRSVGRRLEWGTMLEELEDESETTGGRRARKGEIWETVLVAPCFLHVVNANRPFYPGSAFQENEKGEEILTSAR